MNNQAQTESGVKDAVEYIRLPDLVRAGRYNRFGVEDPDGNLFMGLGGGICHLWGVFPNGLAPGQRGVMTFTNVAGSYPVTGNASEWLRGEPGYSPHAIAKGFQAANVPPIRKELGVWDINVDVYIQEGQPPVKVLATETNELGGNGWVRSYYHAPDFLGIEFVQSALLAFDAAKGKYVASRIKTLQDNMAQYEGTYDEATRTLTMEAEVASGPIREKERRKTTYVDDNTRTFTVERQGPDGKWRLSDSGLATRRHPAANGNRPIATDGLITVESLSRGDRSARVVCRNESNAHRDVATGVVILGPIFIAQFSGSFRP